MSLTCNPQAPNRIISELPADPTINALEYERVRLKTAIAQNYSKINLAKGTPLGLEYDSIQASLQAAKSKRRKLARGDNRQDYFRRRHTKEIKRQLNGLLIKEYIEPTVHHQLPERIELQKILCDFPKDLNNYDLRQRRIDAVN